MTSLPPLSPEMADLLESLCLEELSPADAARLEDLVCSDVQCCRQYIFFMQMHALAERFGAEGRGVGDQRRGMAGLPAIDLSVGAAVEHPVGAAVELPHQFDPESQIPEPRTPNPEPPFPTLSTTNYPLPADPFVGSWAFSCMVATVIMGVMLLVFWAMKVTHHQHIAEAPSQSVPSDDRPEMVFVGRITGMVDVKWSDDPRFLPPLSSRAYVPLGRKYILSSGLLEITYDSGAKVILQGPCTYEVESTAGGYLALGKLTARVEKKRSEVRSQRSDHSPLSPLPSPLFSVRTPTAVITDLGTEFGVEVDKAGASKTHVFQGRVEMRLADGGQGEPLTIQLGVGESGQVEHGADGRGPTLLRGEADPTAFSSVRPGQLAQVAEERRLKPFRRWQAFSEELRNRDDLLAYYDFQPDESDRSVLRNRAATGTAFDGRIGDAPWVSGRFPGKYALRFGWRGSGVHVNIPVECRQLTLAAWVKLDYLPSARAGQCHSSMLMSDGFWGSRPGQMHWRIIQEGAMMFVVHGSVHAIGPPPPEFSGGLRRDQWHFAAATCDLAAGKTSIYLDGALVGEQVYAVPDSAAIKLGGATIGDWDDPSMSPDGRQQLRGRMEELMVFRAALSPADIRRLFELQQPEHTREQR